MHAINVPSIVFCRGMLLSPGKYVSWHALGQGPGEFCGGTSPWTPIGLYGEVPPQNFMF